jgi:hypothetical protein
MQRVPEPERSSASSAHSDSAQEAAVARDRRMSNEHVHKHSDHIHDHDGDGLVDFEGDGFGERQQEWRRTVEHFFWLGVQVGLAGCMCAVAVAMVVVSQAGGLVGELSSLYYPVFRWPLLLAFCAAVYGLTLLMWKRHAINFAGVLGVDEKRHHFHYIISHAFTVVFICFVCFVGCARQRTGMMTFRNSHDDD